MPADLNPLIILCTAAFFAGFVDAIVGGGGLIQTPAALVTLSANPVASILATIKIPSFSGTAFATRQYVKRVKINWQLTSIICVVCFFSAVAGSLLLTKVNNSFMKPVLLVILTIVAIYTFLKKDLGQREKRDVPYKKQLIAGVVISLAIGFYDGFIGPGAGSFFILAFIAFLGFDFLHASAQAKLANLATNLGSITLFLFRGKIMWAFALPMAVCNAIGGILGARLAIYKGNKFIRVFFLIVVTGTLARFFYDVFIKK